MNRVVVWMLRLAPALGLTLVVVGSQEWYPESVLDSKGFVINLDSGFTAACFGVPVAFFVLQRLLADREARREQRALMRSAGTSTDQLRSLVIGPCTFGLDELMAIEELEHTATRLSKQIRQLKAFAEDNPSPINPDNLLAKVSMAARDASEVGNQMFLHDPNAPDRALEVLAFVRNEINRALMRDGRITFPAEALDRLEKYLRWLDDRASPIAHDTPPAFDRLLDFGTADWSSIALGRGSVDQKKRLRAMAQEAQAASIEAKQDLGQARSAFRAILAMELHLQSIASSGKL